MSKTNDKTGDEPRSLDRLVRLVREYQDNGDAITIRELARKLRMKQRDVLDDCHDFNINIGLMCPVGIYEHERIGEYTVEDLSHYKSNARVNLSERSER